MLELGSERVNTTLSLQNSTKEVRVREYKIMNLGSEEARVANEPLPEASSTWKGVEKKTG